MGGETISSLSLNQCFLGFEFVCLMFFFLKLNNLFEYLTGFLATPENPPCIIMFFHEGRNWRLPSPTQPQMLWDTRWQPKTYQINAFFSRKRFDVTFLGKKNSYGIELVLLFRADVSTVFFPKKKCSTER